MKKLNEKYKIVLTDDDPDDCEIFKSALESLSEHIELIIFHRGHDLLEYLASDEELPHLVFLDLNMPLMHGFEVLGAIRTGSRYSNLSVAIYSTSRHQRDVEEAMVKGANIYIAKPNDYKELQLTLEKVLSANWAYHNHALDKSNFYFTL